MKIKKLIAVVLSLVVMVSSLTVSPVFAANDVIASGKAGSECTWELTSDGTLTISGSGTVRELDGEDSYRRKVTKVIIEDGITDLSRLSLTAFINVKSIQLPNTITEIPQYRLNSLTSLESIVIPEGVTKIDRHAFSGLSKLRSVSFPDSLESIGGWAFDGCSSLESITIPEGLTEIDGFTFQGCSSLKSVIIPDSITRINSGAFDDCTSLSSVTFGNQVEILDAAFNNCTSLTSVELPESLERYESTTFYGCTSLESINISNNNQYFTSVDGILYSKDMKTLYCYPAAKEGSTFVLPESVTTVCDGAFAYASNLVSIDLSAIYDVKAHTLAYCTSLESVKLPTREYAHIGNGAFEGCVSLTTIDIPAGVELIGDPSGDTVFTGCSSLQNINVDENNKDYSSLDGVLFSNSSSWVDGEKVYADKDVLEVYPEGKTAETYVIPSTVKKIERGFEGNKYLTHISIPEGVEWIGSYVDCSSLVSIDIPSSAKAAKLWNNFDGCISLESINVDAENTTICSVDGVLFSEDMKDLYKYPSAKKDTYYSVPDTVTEIWYNAFEKCKNLVNVELSEQGWLSLDSQVFYECEKLESIRFFADGSPTIPGEAFNGCKNLKYVVITPTRTSISEDAFKDCTGLTDVYFAGTEEEFDSLVIWEGNDAILNAKIHYNSYGPAEKRNIILKDTYELNINVPYYYEDITWKSSNSKVATVNDGVVTSVSYGSAKITAVLDDGTVVRNVQFSTVFSDVISGTGEKGYGDASNSSTFKAIYWAADNGISRGYTSGENTGKFLPKANVSREEMAIFLYRLAGAPKVNTNATLNFTDASMFKKGSGAYNAVLWMQQNNITKGKKDSNGKYYYDPKGEVTRQELAIFLYRLAKYQNRKDTKKVAVTTFADDKDISNSTARTAIYWAVGEGIIKGYSADSTFRPAANCSREQMVLMMTRYKK